MTLVEFWVRECMGILANKPDAYVQIRKMFQDHSFYCDWETFQSGELPNFKQLGYKNNTNKSKQLERNYFNEKELTRIRETFLMRLGSSGNKSLQTCVSARMGNKEKDSRSQGFCMQTVTINYLKVDEGYQLVLELNYRSTELTQKFLADLIFLRERVFPFIMDGWPDGLKPGMVKFNFSVCYLSLMFMPVLFQHHSVLYILETIKDNDPKFYSMVISAMGRLMVEECTYNYKTRASMHKLFWDEVHHKLKKQEIRRISKLIAEARKDV